MRYAKSLLPKLFTYLSLIYVNHIVTISILNHNVNTLLSSTLCLINNYVPTVL